MLVLGYIQLVILLGLHSDCLMYSKAPSLTKCKTLESNYKIPQMQYTEMQPSKNILLHLNFFSFLNYQSIATNATQL